METKGVVEESSDSGRFSPSSAGDSHLPVDLFDDDTHTVDDSINEIVEEDSKLDSVLINTEETSEDDKPLKSSISGKSTTAASSETSDNVLPEETSEDDKPLKSSISGKSTTASSSKTSDNDLNQDEQKAEEEKCYKRIIHLLNSSKFFSSFLLGKMEESGLNQDKNKAKSSSSDKSESTSTSKRVLADRNSNRRNVRGKRPMDDENKEDNPPMKLKKRKKINVAIRDVLSKEQVQEAHRQHMEREAMEAEEKENEVEESSPEIAETKVTSMGVTVPKSQPNLLIGGALRDYQLKGLEWLKVLFENGVSGILADEMGLGKTIQVISLLCYLIEKGVPGPYLIVAPLSTLSNWLQEFEKFAPEIPVVVLHGNKEERKPQREQIKKATRVNDKLTAVMPVVVTSYQVPLMERELMYSINWQYIVVDEGHRIKNKETQLSRVLASCTSQNRLLLTGTPLQNNLTELWTLLNFLLPDMFDDLTTFNAWLDLNNAGKDAQKILQKEKESQMVSTLHQILFPFVLRRTKKDIAIDIPPKKEVVVYCPMTEVQREMYEHVITKNIRNKIPHFELGKLPAKRTVETSYRDFFSDDLNLYLQYEKILSSGEMPDRDSTIRKESMKKKRNDFFDLSELPKCKELQERMGCEFKERVKMQKAHQTLLHIVNHPYLVMMPYTGEKNNRMLFVNEEMIKTSGKFLVLDALLAKLKERGHKVLLFSTSVMLLDMAEDLMIMKNHSYVRLDGGSSLMARKDDIFAFNTDPNLFAFLISTRAGGLGINLTSADTVILLNSDWNPMADLQAQDRAHRIGQTRPVVVYRFTVSNTVDEQIVLVGNNKKIMEKVVMKSDVFKMNRVPELDLLELAMLLKEKKEKEFVHSDSCGLTEEELEVLLDRSDMAESGLSSKITDGGKLQDLEQSWTTNPPKSLTEESCKTSRKVGRPRKASKPNVATPRQQSKQNVELKELRVVVERLDSYQC